MEKRKLLLVMTLMVLLVFAVAGKAAAGEHTVSRGESLYKIAQWYNTTAWELQKANNLPSPSIYPGQVLWVPTYHTVSAGESLFLIGEKYGTNYSQISKYNGLTTTEIHPGQKLYIPTTNTASASTENTSQNNNYNNYNNVSSYEQDLLARIITAEADSESYRTKVAVGAVVLNRVESSKFPNSIHSVIYQVDNTGRYQFSPVLNGWINRPASSESIRAAQEALQGSDPSYEALYFWESWVQNSFLNSRPVTTVLGAFTFTR